MDLAAHAFNVCSIDDARLVEDLYRYRLVRRDVHGCLHFAEGALSECLPALDRLLPQLVVTDYVLAVRFLWLHINIGVHHKTS